MKQTLELSANNAKLKAENSTLKQKLTRAASNLTDASQKLGQSAQKLVDYDVLKKTIERLETVCCLDVGKKKGLA